jgi:hypothetical protein
MALSVDYLRLTGDPQAADALELGTLNGGLGAQHPSGRWWTYNTPMDGLRQASAHTIVFQARAGTPELNCCSVNGPRVLGLLSEWAVMSVPGGVAINSYLPGNIALTLNGREIRLSLDRDYPATDSQRVVITGGGGSNWTMHLRIPAWSARASLKANFQGVPAQAAPGSYVEIHRYWKPGDEVVLQFEFGLRAVAGANEAAGKVSLYRGPLLLAYDQADNGFDEDKIPALNLSRLNEARLTSAPTPALPLQHQAWVQLDLPMDNGSRMRLVDFASAGSSGTRYRSWLPVINPPPPPAFTQYPRDGERVRPGVVQFQWRGPRRGPELGCRLELAADARFSRVLLSTNSSPGPRLRVDLGKLAVASTAECWWRVVTFNSNGETMPDVPSASFTLAADAPPQTLPPEIKPGPKGELVLHSLRDQARPSFGEMLSSNCTPRAGEGLQVNGRDQRLVYGVPAWPEEDFTVGVRVRIDQMPTGRIGQIFSAWAAGMDDPLRLVVDNGKLFARIEAGGAFGTTGVPITGGRWYHVAGIKRGATLALFVDGQPVASGPAPEFTVTAARDCALGGNPHFGGNEFLAATFAELGMWDRALSEAELRRIATGK